MLIYCYIHNEIYVTQYHSVLLSFLIILIILINHTERK